MVLQSLRINGGLNDEMQPGLGVRLKRIDLNLNVGFGATLCSNSFDIFVRNQQESLANVLHRELSFQPIHGVSSERTPAVMHLDSETRRDG